MNSILTFALIAVAALIVFAVPTLVAPYASDYGAVTVFDTSMAVLLCGALAGLVGYLSYHQDINGSFLLKLFILALLVRIIVSTAIFVFNGQAFFGGDALTYDYFGYVQLRGWMGDSAFQSRAIKYLAGGANPGWGMVYLVAAIYGLVGRNMLAVQFVNAVMGAATAPIIFFCAYNVFQNLRVARLAAVAVAFSPRLCFGHLRA